MNTIHPYWYIGVSLLLALIPLVLGAATSYLKVSLALNVLRNGFGAQQVPGAATVMVLSLVLSFYIMQPIFGRVFKNFESMPFPDTKIFQGSESLKPYFEALAPWQEFLKNQSGTKEVQTLREISKSDSQSNSFRVLLPAFVLTELKEGLMIGFILLLPFLVIDLVIANILAGLGMYMMSPTIISLPLKLLLFVTVDGWLLISRGLIASYG